MLKNIKGLKEVIIDLIDERVEKRGVKSVKLFVITGVNEDLTFNIKELNVNNQYDNVEMMSLGLGNGKGLVFVPAVNSIVIVGFIGNSEYPIILGTLFDNFSNVKDAKLPIKQNEVIVVNKTNGAYFYIKDDNTIKMRNPSGEYIELNDKGLKASNYYSNDGSKGITQELSVRNSSNNGTSVIKVKNGIIIGFT